MRCFGIDGVFAGVCEQIAVDRRRITSPSEAVAFQVGQEDADFVFVPAEAFAHTPEN